MLFHSHDSGCPAFATDTIVITHDPGCVVLANNEVNFKGTLKNNMVNLNRSVSRNQGIQFLTIERGTDGTHFTLVDTVNSQSMARFASYQTIDNVHGLRSSYVYYRIKISARNGTVTMMIASPITFGQQPAGRKLQLTISVYFSIGLPINFQMKRL